MQLELHLQIHSGVVIIDSFSWTALPFCSEASFAIG